MALYEGKIIHFNGKFGFIKFQLGEAFFHSSVLTPKQQPIVKKGIFAKFSVIPSKKKSDSWEVSEFYEFFEERNQSSDLAKAEIIGEVLFFDESKGFGFLKDVNGEYFFHKSRLENAEALEKNDICLFYKKPSTKKNRQI
jgi:cold shock CspA family protein